MMPFFAIDTECGDENSLYFKRNLANANTTANTTVPTTTNATASSSYYRSTPSVLQGNINHVPIGYRTNKFCNFSDESN
jgi:hypothetical protein